MRQAAGVADGSLHANPGSSAHAARITQTYRLPTHSAIHVPSATTLLIHVFGDQQGGLVFKDLMLPNAKALRWHP